MAQVIVSSWDELLTAIGGGATDIKFSDSGTKYISTVNIGQRINSNILYTIDFNGWTIDEMNVFGFEADNMMGFPVIVNLRLNHLNLYNTLKPTMSVFWRVESSYFDDIYVESRASTYTGFAANAGANVFMYAYNSTFDMRSQDYAPRVPWRNHLMESNYYDYTPNIYNCAIGFHYKWTKRFTSDNRVLYGCLTAFHSCYIYGKVDLSEGKGGWQGNVQTDKIGNNYKISLLKSIMNLETIISEDSSIYNFYIMGQYRSGTQSWDSLPDKSLIVTDNGNAATAYQSELKSDTTVYIDGVRADLVSTLKEDLKNKDWLNDIAFGFIDDDNYRYPEWGGVCAKTSGTEGAAPTDLWTWRKSNYVNNTVPFLPFYKYPVVEPPVYHGDVYENEYICIFDMQTQQDGFSGHGLAILRPYTCRVVEELNGSYNLTLTHPKDAEGAWQYILEMNIIKCMGQLFVIQRVDEVINGGSYYVQAYAEHITYTLNDRWIFPPVTIAGYHGATLMASILEQSTDMGGDWQVNYTFTVSSDIDAPEDFRDWYELSDGVTPYEMLLGSNGFIAKLGGKLYRDNFTMIINEEMYGAQENAFELSIGYNLTGIKRTVDLTTFCTYFRAYDVSDGEYGTWWAVSYDPSTLPRAYPRNVVRSKNFTYDHDEYKEGQLVRDGFAFWCQNCAPLITYELNIKDLRRTPEYKDFANNYRFRVGDKGRVWDERLQTWSNVEITRTEKDGITGDTVKVIIGSQRSFTRPNSYNPIVPVNIDADKIIEGMPPITFMSDGGLLHHITFYGAGEAPNGVGEEYAIEYDNETNTHYDTSTGEPDSDTGWTSIEITDGFTQGIPYTVTVSPNSQIQALYYTAADAYISYADSAYYVGSFRITPPANTKKIIVQVLPNEEVAVDISVTGLAIPVVITGAFDSHTDYVPLAAKLVTGQSIDLSSSAFAIQTYSGENTLTVNTTVQPRVKIQYREPVNSYERVTQGEPPLTVNANGSNLSNWIIYGAEGGVIGGQDIFFGELENKFYNPSTGEPMASDFYYASVEMIPVTEGITYECEAVWAGETIGTAYFVIYYDSNGDFMSSYNAGGLSISFTVPTGVAYIRVQGYVRNDDYVITDFIINKPVIPIIVSSGTNSQTVYIPVTAPLVENQSVSFEGTGINIPTYNGQTTISVDSQVQPIMKIQYMEKRS